MTAVDLEQLDTEAIDLAFVDQTVARLGRTADKLIPLLQAVQEHYRFLPLDALKRIAAITDCTPASITGVATFYSQFRHMPVGNHLISVCHGTACHVKGAQLVTDAIRMHLGIEGEDDTDANGVFTVQKVACLGCCTLAPVLTIDGVAYGHLTYESAPKAVRDFLELVKSGKLGSRQQEDKRVGSGLAEIRIGVGSCCIAGGSMKVREALEAAVLDLDAPVVVKPVGCVGMCHQTPLVEVVTPETGSALYAKVNPDDAAGIVKQHFQPKGFFNKFRHAVSGALDGVLTDEVWEPITRYSIDTRDAPVCAFLGRQKHIATQYCGSIDPLDLESYLAGGGFESLRACITGKSQDEIIESVTASGLRGRGGAGFLTGLKWKLVRQQPAEPKYVVMNGDEGDPGAFMDRMLLESYPYRVLEGLAIAARAVGANEGVLYIRAEYPLAVQRVQAAIAKCEALHLLGEGIFGTDFSLTLRIMEGAGAFVCGEETALLNSIEGKRGMPRLRPPYPAEKGLWDQPTLINNVETYSLIPWIMAQGSAAFNSLGTADSKGTKVFALTGKVLRGGLIEVPMGITIREVVEDIGGGVAGNHTFKAVQIGGPSGGCLPAEACGTEVDYKALIAAGAMMGSGGLVVMDDRDCMVDMARYFLTFTQEESCGKCTFCRIGTKRMLDVLERLCKGEGKKGDLERLEAMAHEIKRGSLCGLGQTAPNPVLTTLRYFRHEYEAHLDGHCPAGKCPALIKYVVKDNCFGCTKCAQICPVAAIAMKPYEKHEVDMTLCTRCDSCRLICPVEAIVVES